MSSIKIRTKPSEDGLLVRILMTHPMETGRRQDQDTGATIPAHYIEEATLELNGKALAKCQFGTAVSRDPYLSFRLRQAKPGDRLRVSWRDNLGRQDSEETEIPAI